MLVPCAAHADAVADAKELFAQGRELRGRGDCANALPLFRRANAIYPAGLGSLRNLAECEELLGQFAAARGTWRDLERDLLQNSEPKYAGWSEDAEQGAARLASKVATLTVELTGTTQAGKSGRTDDVEVTLNGESVSPGLLGTEIDRDPGRYLVRVTGSPAGFVREQWVDLSAGETKRVIVDVSSMPGGSVRGPADGTARRAAAWVAIGIGAAGLVGAGVSLLVRQTAINTLHDDGCPDVGGNLMCNGPSTSALESTADRGQVASTLVNVFAAVGAVGLAGGLVLLATSPSRSATQTALVLSPSGVAAMGRF